MSNKRLEPFFDNSVYPGEHNRGWVTDCGRGAVRIRNLSPWRRDGCFQATTRRADKMLATGERRITLGYRRGHVFCSCVLFSGLHSGPRNGSSVSRGNAPCGGRAAEVSLRRFFASAFIGDCDVAACGMDGAARCPSGAADA